jgi:hypothetical protein
VKAAPLFRNQKGIAMKFRKRKANVTNVNNRKENHGEEKVLAIDVKFCVAGTPKLLDDFDARMRECFFLTEEGKENYPRFPEITSFKWGREYEDAKIRVGEEDFDEVKLKGFEFECKEGGVVELTFTASWRPNPDDVGALAELIKEEVTVSFTTQFDLVDEAEGKGKGGEQPDTAVPPGLTPLLGVDGKPNAERTKH